MKDKKNNENEVKSVEVKKLKKEDIIAMFPSNLELAVTELIKFLKQ